MRRNYCRSVISLPEPLPHSLWISLDLRGILAIVWTPAYYVASICVCWPHKRCVYNITSSSLLHRKYLLLLCCLLKVSQYRLALIDVASVHIVKGISQHIHNSSISSVGGGGALRVHERKAYYDNNGNAVCTNSYRSFFV